MSEAVVKRGKDIYLLMTELAESFSQIKSLLISEIALGDQGGLKAEYLESLIACQDILDKCIRMLTRMMPARSFFKARRIEKEIKQVLLGIKNSSRDMGSFGSLIGSIVRPDLDRLYKLMDEYSTI